MKKQCQQARIFLISLAFLAWDAVNCDPAGRPPFPFRFEFCFLVTAEPEGLDVLAGLNVSGLLSLSSVSEWSNFGEGKPLS